MSEERRGGLRRDPQRVDPGAMEAPPSRSSASSMRAVDVPRDGLYANISGDDGPWRYVGDVGEPPFFNSWANSGGGFASAAFMKDALGIVHIKGIVKNGTTVNSTVFILPAGYRPKLELIFGAVSNNVIGRLDIQADGSVLPVIGSTAWFTIQATFPAEQ